jgi:hypothetical protein
MELQRKKVLLRGEKMEATKLAEAREMPSSSQVFGISRW